MASKSNDLDVLSDFLIENGIIEIINPSPGSKQKTYGVYIKGSKISASVSAKKLRDTIRNATDYYLRYIDQRGTAADAKTISVKELAKKYLKENPSRWK